MARGPIRQDTTVVNSPVGFADTSGINRAGEIAARSLSSGNEIAETAFNFAQKSLAVQRRQEAVSDAANVDFEIDPITKLPRLPELPSTLSVYGEEYQKNVIRNYGNRIETDISTTLTEKATEFPYEPQKFQEYAGEYIKETLRQVDPRARGFVQEAAHNSYKRLVAGIISRKAEEDYKGMQKDEAVAVRQRESTAIQAIGTAGAGEAFANVMQSYENSGFLYRTPGARAEAKAKFRDRYAYGLMEAEVFKIKDKVEREKAILDAYEGKGKLVTDEVKALGIPPEVVHAHARAINEVKSQFNSLENAADAVTGRVMAAQLLDFMGREFKESYGISLDSIGMTQEAVKRHPGLAITALRTLATQLAQKETRERQTKTREDQAARKESSEKTASIMLGLVRDRINGQPPDLYAQIKPRLDEIEAKAADVQVDHRLRILTAFASDVEADIRAYTKRLDEEGPFRAAGQSFDADGKTSPLVQNEKTAATSDRLLAESVRGKPWAGNYNDPTMVGATFQHIARHGGVVPASFGQYLFRLAQGEPQDVARAAVIVKDFTERTGLSATRLGTAMRGGGDKIIAALDLYATEADLTQAGIASGPAYERFRQRMQGDTAAGEKAFLEALEGKTEADKRATVHKLLQTTVAKYLSPDSDNSDPLIVRMLGGSLRGNLPVYGTEFRDEVLKVFYASGASLARDGSYDNAMRSAFETVLHNGSWGPSRAGIRYPGTFNLDAAAQFTKYPLERQFESVAPDLVDTGMKKAEETVNLLYEQSAKALNWRSVGIKLEFGKNAFLQYYKDDLQTGMPLYHVLMKSEMGDHYLVNPDGRVAAVNFGGAVQEIRTMAAARANKEGHILIEKMKDAAALHGKVTGQ